MRVPWIRDDVCTRYLPLGARTPLVRDRTGPQAPMPPPASPAGPASPRLLDRLRNAIRTVHYSRRTEEAYVAWVRRFILFHGKRHPADMGARDVTAFLMSLAVERG